MTSNLWWEEASDGLVPVYSVEIGVNVAGETLYVGRARLEDGDVVPGMVCHKLGGCQVLHDGVEKIVADYEVLVCRDCDNLTWRRSYTPDVIPCGAIIGGRMGKINELVYIARGRLPELPDVIYGGILRKGQPVVVPYNKKQVELPDYQILCDTYCV